MAACENDGVCVNTQGSYYCECKDGYDGHRCEYEVNECASYPCNNDCVCIDHIGSYECQCNVENNQCSSNPCDSGCSCVDKIRSYECQCMENNADSSSGEKRNWQLVLNTQMLNVEAFDAYFRCRVEEFK